MNYKEKIKALIDNIDSEDALRYLFIVTNDLMEELLGKANWEQDREKYGPQ